MAITLQIIGHKKSGKTLITEELTKQLTRQGIDVAVFKHGHEGQLDQPGTDSARFSQAGAKQVIFSTPQGYFYHHQGSQPSLEQLIADLPTEPTIILAEGFKRAPFPKLVLLKTGESRTEFSEISNIIQFASIDPEVTCCELNSSSLVIEWVLKYLKEAK